jgi:Sortase domain
MDPPARRSGRAARAAGTVAVAAGIACATAAIAIAGDGSSDLDVTGATIAVAPKTVPPVAAPKTPVLRTPPSTAAIPTSSSTTTLPLSPLHTRLGASRSAVPEPLPPDILPAVISIDAIGVWDVPVRPVGLLPDGQLEIPGADDVGWYRLGAAPGEPGSTVLAAHVSWSRRSGPFRRLGELEPGAAVSIGLTDGGSRNYTVVERSQHDKRTLPAAIWRTSGPETLVMITCGGEFDPVRRRYADNIVITAVPTV